MLQRPEARPAVDEELRAAEERWRASVEDHVRTNPERRPRFSTTSEITIDRLYTPTHLAENDPVEDIGFPGEYPYTRGIHPTMYRGRLWTMRQYAGYATAEESNRRYRYLLAQGQTGLSVAFDLPTQIGYDSDHPRARAEVGKVGVAISSLEDMEALLDGIPLDKVSTSMTINATAAILLALYVAVAKRRGIPLEKLSGTVQNDILKEYIARGTYIFPPAPSLRLVTDVIAFCSERLPKWNPISISGYHMREAGCTAVQEVAFTMADACAYVQSCLDRGLDVDRFAPRLSFFFCAHNDLLEEVAKFRAARRMWARLMRERFGAKDPRSWMLRFHTQTAGCTLTAQQPEVNVVRVAIQALAAVLGGTQSLHTNAMDEALALPTEKTARIALRTQQVIAHESGVVNTVDPLGGSYYVEWLTDEIERRAFAYLERVEQLGGTLWAVENGFFQREIGESAYRYQQEVDSGDRIIVGVNAYHTDEPTPVEILRVDPAVQRARAERLQALRARRDQAVASGALARLEQAAKGRDNLVPFIIDAVEAWCTLGEICDTLRSVFGEYQENVQL
jgi:methylmalonyl-CoA mutase N-terminal domain/subunit